MNSRSRATTGEDRRLSEERNRRRLVVLLWVYFVLMIIEGALRKWVMPQWSSELLLVRDPIAVAVIYLGVRDGFLPVDGFVRALLWLLAAFTVLGVLQIILYGVPASVVAFGIRAYFLHVPMIFVMARVLERADLRRLMAVTLLLAVPIVWLMVLQFRADPYDWLNAGTVAGAAVGDDPGQMLSALGRVRPAGPFSFVTGPVLYFGLVAASLVAAHFQRTRLPALIRVCGWVALLIAAAVSGSRSLVFGLVPVALMIGLAVVRRPRLASDLARAGVVFAAISMVLWGSTVVQEGLEVFTTRMSQSGGTDEMLYRSADVYASSAGAFGDSPLLGLGIGLGTNAGSSLAGDGGNFRFGENEWSRILYEAGPVLGAAYLAWRVSLVFWVFGRAFKAVSIGDVLPLTVFGACVTNFLLGPWGQPTTQGFAVWAAGLCLAGSRVPAVGFVQGRPITPSRIDAGPSVPEEDPANDFGFPEEAAPSAQAPGFDLSAIP
jgi:hypothetical protein